MLFELIFPDKFTFVVNLKSFLIYMAISQSRYQLFVLLVMFFSFGSLYAQEEELIPDPFDREVEITRPGDTLLLSSRPGYAEYRQALALRDRFDYPGALGALRQALARDSANTVWWSELADLYIAMGNSVDALHAYQHALTITPGHLPLKGRMGRLLLTMQENRDAYRVFTELRKADSLNLFFNRQLAISASRLNKSGEAKQLFLKVLEMNPRDLGSSLALATLYQQDTAFVQAGKILADAQELFPGNSLVELRLAQNDYYLKEYARAAEGYAQYLSHNDTTLNVRKEYGVVLYFNKEEDKALRMLEPALYLTPNDPMIPFYMGLSYKNLKDFEAAQQYLKLAEELSMPWYLPVIHRTMAQVHGLCREFPKAIASYRKVLELDPADYEVLFEMATTYEEFEPDKSVAYQYYRKYLEKAGNDALNEAYARNRMAKIREALFFDNRGQNLVLPD